MSNITWEGVLIGFFVAGVVGYIAMGILFHTDAVGAFTEPQAVVQHTQLSPAQVLWQAVRSVFCLFIIVSSGTLTVFLAYVMVSQGLEEVLWLVILELLLLAATLLFFARMPFLLILFLCFVQALVVWYVSYNWDVFMGLYRYY